MMNNNGAPLPQDDRDDDDKTNLIINYLPQVLTDTEFYQLFASVGTVTSARIIRDKKTNYSFGYGFVNYAKAADAAQAIEQLNGQLLKNKTIKVAYSQPSGYQTKNINLYVSGLPADMTDEKLQTFFVGYGTITQCRAVKDKNTGMCQGFGFVLFSNRDEATEAIKGLDGSPLPDGGNGCLTVKFAKSEQKLPPSSFLSKGGRMPYAMSPFGPNSGGRGGGGGGPLRGLSFRGRYSPMAVARSSMTSQMANNTNYYGGGAGDYTPTSTSETIVFVYGIGPHTDEDQLWEMFGQYGNITRVNVIWDHAKGAGKGYGFVTFSTYSEAMYAVHNMNNSTYQGRQLQVSIKS